MTIAFKAESKPEDTILVAHFSGREFFRTENSGESLELNIADAVNVQWEQIEVRLLDAGTEEVLASDTVSVFLLGDGIVAPEDLDDVDPLFRNVAAIETAMEEILRLNSSRSVEDAERKIREMLSHLSNVPGRWVPELYTHLGQTLLSRGDLEGALLAFRDAIWHTPTYMDAHSHLSAILTAQVEFDTVPTPLRRGDEADLARSHRRTFFRLGGQASQIPVLKSLPAVQRLYKVGILCVASGAYARFFKAHVLSAERYLLRDIAELHYYVFTDSVETIAAEMNATIPWRCVAHQSPTGGQSCGHCVQKSVFSGRILRPPAVNSLPEPWCCCQVTIGD